MTPEEERLEYGSGRFLEGYLEGIKDFKLALREEIEKEKHYVGTSGSSVNFKQGYIEALIRIENLIEYVTPKS